MITLKCDDRTLSTSIPGNKGVTVSKQMADNSGILQTKEFTYSITVPRTIDSI
jgi:formylmethanofuran dehydrogenase subunit D